MFVEWSTDDHMCDAFRTDVHPMTPDGICKWSLHDSKSCTRSSITLIFKIYFSPKIHWMDISTVLEPSPIDSKTKTVLSEDHTIELSFTYFTSEGFCQKLGTHLVVTVTELSLKLLHLDATMEEFNRVENHKVSLFLKLLKREECMVMRSIYLGRAQEIQTTEHGGTRIYTWLSTKEPPAFDGIGFRRISELGDMDEISHSPNVSPRPKQTYVMDNDEFSNLSRVLPTGMMDGETLRLQFFNFKFTPPKCLEASLPWKEIIDIPALFTIRDQNKKVVKKRFSLRLLKREEPPSDVISVSRFETNPSEGVTLRVTYERIDATKLVIREIKLIVRRYLLNLHYFGADVCAQTI